MSQATLSTERLTLRPLRMSDIGPIQLYASEERLARMTTSIPHPLPPGAAESFVEKSMAERGAETVWAITPKNGLRDELVGLISVEQNGPLNAGELGYWVGEPFREVGYATEAVVALVGHLVELGMDQIHAAVFQDNPSSPKVLTKAGFALVGEGEAFSVAREATVKQWLYRLDADAVGAGAEAQETPLP